MVRPVDDQHGGLSRKEECKTVKGYTKQTPVFPSIGNIGILRQSLAINGIHIESCKQQQYVAEAAEGTEIQ